MTTATLLRIFKSSVFAVAVVSVVSIAFFIGNGADAQSSSVCVDSDNTLDYYGKGPEQVNKMNDDSKNIKGTINASDSNGNLFNETDVCEDSIKIKEHFCDRGLYYGNIILNCSNGCKDGVCIKEKKSECIDSDNGKDYFTKGIVKEGAVSYAE